MKQIIVSTLLVGLAGCGPVPEGDVNVVYGNNARHSNYVVVNVQTSRGIVECVRLNEIREGGLSCDWNNVLTTGENE